MSSIGGAAGHAKLGGAESGAGRAAEGRSVAERGRRAEHLHADHIAIERERCIKIDRVEMQHRLIDHMSRLG